MSAPRLAGERCRTLWAECVRVRVGAWVSVLGCGVGGGRLDRIDRKTSSARAVDKK